MGFKVGFTDGFRLGIDFAYEKERFQKAGIEFEVYNCNTEDDIFEQMQDCDVHILVAAPYTKRVIDGLPKLKGLCRFGIGVDSIDVPAATEKGVKVCNDTGYCLEEVATHAFALILDLFRKTTLLDRSVRGGEWKWSAGYEARNLTGITVGLAGCGNIARYLIRFLAPFHCRVIAYDPFLDAETIAARGAEKVSFDELLEQSDVISIHCHLTEQTRHMFDAEAFRKMKKGSFIVNVSRGALIDTYALADAIRAGQLQGAGLDTHESEPLVADHPLRTMDTVVLTPHSAHYSSKAFETLRCHMVDQAIAVIEGTMPQFLFNRKQLGL